MSTLILWRHGQTDYNLGKRVQGRVDIALNETGLAQARAAAPALAAARPCRIVSSPLGRARATAQVLADLTGLGVEVDEDLTERSFGAWEGLSRAEMEQGWPQELAAWRRGSDPQGVGVEPRGEAAERVGASLRAITQGSGAGETVVVVSHGAATTLGATHLLRLDPTTWFGLSGLDNCHHGVLRPSGREPGWELVSWNVGGPAGPGE